MWANGILRIYRKWQMIFMHFCLIIHVYETIVNSIRRRRKNKSFVRHYLLVLGEELIKYRADTHRCHTERCFTFHCLPLLIGSAIMCYVSWLRKNSLFYFLSSWKLQDIEFTIPPKIDRSPTIKSKINHISLWSACHRRPLPIMLHSKCNIIVLCHSANTILVSNLFKCQWWSIFWCVKCHTNEKAAL